jgi:hypothetical protein
MRCAEKSQDHELQGEKKEVGDENFGGDRTAAGQVE